MNLCEKSNGCLLTITRRMQKHTQVMMPCGYLATVYIGRHHQEERQKLSSRAAARGYQSPYGHRNANYRDADDRNANDGRTHGTVLPAAAYDFASSTFTMVMRSHEYFFLLIWAIHDEAYQGSCRTARSNGLAAAALSIQSKKPVRIPTRRTPTILP
jgi:hypothetical protein